MRRIVGVVLVVVGVILLVWGFQEAESLASEFSEFFTGSPTDRSMWLMIGGVVALIVGASLAAIPGRLPKA